MYRLSFHGRIERKGGVFVELKILNYLCDHGGHADYADLLNAFPSILETDGFLQMLKDGGYISASLTAYSQVVLTPKGRAYRSKLSADTEEHTNERTYVRAENRTTKVVAVIAAVASVVAAILAALAYFFPR